MDTLAPSRHSTGPLAPSGTLQGSPLPVSERPAPSPAVAAALQLPHHWNDLELLLRDSDEFLRRCQVDLARFWLRLGYQWPRNIMDRVEVATLDAVRANVRASSSKATTDILALYSELIVPIIQDVDKGLSMSPNTKHLSRLAHNESTNYIEPPLRTNDVASMSSRASTASRRPASPSGTSSYSENHGNVVPFKSIVKRSVRREYNRLAPVNITYRGGDHDMNWRHSVSVNSQGSNRRASSPSDAGEHGRRVVVGESQSKVAIEDENDVHPGRNSGLGKEWRRERTAHWAKHHVAEYSMDEYGARLAPETRTCGNGGDEVAVAAAEVQDDGVVVRRRADSASSDLNRGHGAAEPSALAAVATAWFEKHPHVSSRRAQRMQELAMQASQDALRYMRGWVNDPPDAVKIFEGLLQTLTEQYQTRREERRRARLEEVQVGIEGCRPGIELSSSKETSGPAGPLKSSLRPLTTTSTTRLLPEGQAATIPALKSSRGSRTSSSRGNRELLECPITVEVKPTRVSQSSSVGFDFPELKATLRVPPGGNDLATNELPPLSLDLNAGGRNRRQLTTSRTDDRSVGTDNSGPQGAEEDRTTALNPAERRGCAAPGVHRGSDVVLASSNAERALWLERVVEGDGNGVHGVVTRHAEFVEPVVGSETMARATRGRVDGRKGKAGVIALAHRVLDPVAAGRREKSVHGVFTRHAGPVELFGGSERKSEAIHTRVDGKEVGMGGEAHAHSRGACRGRAEQMTSALKVAGNDLCRSRDARRVSAPWMASLTPSRTCEKVHIPSKTTPACSKAREKPSPRHAGLNFPRPSMVDPARSQGLARVSAVPGHTRGDVSPGGEGLMGDGARGTSRTPLDGGVLKSTKRSHVTSTETHMTPDDLLPDATGHDPVLLAAVRGLQPSGCSPFTDLLARITADMARGVYTSQIDTTIRRYWVSDREVDSFVDLVNHGARYQALEWFMESGRWRPPLTARRIMSMTRQPRGYLPRLVDMVFDHMEVERAFITNVRQPSTPSTVPRVNHYDDDSNVELSNDDIAGNNSAHDYESDEQLVSASRSPNPSVVGGYDCSETRSAFTNVEYLACMRQLVSCQTSDEGSLGNGRLSKGTVDAPEILAYDVRTYRCEEECGDFRYYTEEFERVSVNSDDFVDEPMLGSDYESDQSSRSDQEEGGSIVDYYDTENEEGIYEDAGTQYEPNNGSNYRDSEPDEENEEGIYEDAGTQYEPNNGSNYRDSEPDEGSESSDFYSDGY
ncbi:hypothetical protein FPV67DRAFT_1776934 [Lyophyllum atratum]|nr:hypothetical protein FPV67DRAFT_1776934 [Lyophyllum atratum]